MSRLNRKKDGEDADALRAEVSRVREEARQALSHMRSELDALRQSQESVRDVDSVTEQLALQQELDTIRHTLNEKERLVDSTAAQCRRLEDALEDQHLAYDGLKQDLEREKLSLAAAREEVARVSDERLQIQARYQGMLSAERLPATKERSTKRHAAVTRGSGPRVVGGLLAGVALAGIGFLLWMWLEPLAVQDEVPQQGEDVVAPVAANPEPGSDEEPAAVDADPGPVVGDVKSQPVVLGTVRDSLRNGSAGPTMLVLQGGNFTMGKVRALPNNDEGPAHKVRLGGFLIGETEVTFEEYDRFARATGRRSPQDLGWGRGRRPVIDVSWDDARAYAGWLSRQTGRNYRLPSEAEWEYAAAAGRRSSFWWGYKKGEGRAVCFDCGTRWDNRSSAPVASLDPNPIGVYDTAGNVMEWVQDCYHPNYKGAPMNGLPWDGESCRFRVARGGAFNKPARSMLTTTRHRFDPDTRINYLGFRLARDE